jgi:ubiquinone/menaquinone biosynthesis C-methylase UbiE
MNEDVAKKIQAETVAAYNTVAVEYAAVRGEVWPTEAPWQPAAPVGGRVLDIGCGDGRAVALFAGQAVEYEGLDASTELINLARRDHADHLATFRVGSMLSLPYENESFDSVLILSSLHHMPSAAERRQALLEATRVLKPGGHLYMTNWDLWTWRRLWRYFPQLLGNALLRLVGRSSLAWNDLFHAWQTGSSDSVRRFYHCFTRRELARLCTDCGLIVIGNIRLVILVTVCRKPGEVDLAPRGVTGL